MLTWSTAVPAVGAAFGASVVEVVEAFTIVLAVGTVYGWRPAIIGSSAALVTLAAMIVALGGLLGAVPIHLLQFVIGVLLLLFGMRWLHKAILRAAGVVPLRDEQSAYADKTDQLSELSRQARPARVAWIAGLAAYKGVLLEGIEVAFIVIAVGAGRGLLWPAALGAFAACLLVLGIGALIHRPLARVPENTLKFAVGVMLSSFGMFWTGEGLGVEWPGNDAALLVFALLFAAVGLGIAGGIRGRREQVRP